MYAKIFEQIFDSSIADNWKTRVVFQDFLVLSDQDGVVDRTPEAIAARTRMPLEMVLEAIRELEAPDLRSRSPEFDGRRIVRLDDHRDWGWKIVNFHVYRDIKTQFDRRAYMRKYMQDRRNKHSVKLGKTESLTESNRVNTPVSVSVSGSGDRGTGKGLNGAETVVLNQELDRVTKKIDSIRSTYGDHQSWSDEDVEKLKKLVNRKRYLKERLGISY